MRGEREGGGLRKGCEWSELRRGRVVDVRERGRCGVGFKN